MKDRRELVVTRQGLGRIEDWRDNDPEALIELDTPFLGKKFITFDKVSGIVRLSDHAIVRVVNLESVGFFSNLQFRDGTSEALDHLWLPTPPNETTFYLNLRTGKMKLNRELGLLAKRFMWIMPWADQWGYEQTQFFEKHAKAVKAFEERRDALAGSTGIGSSILLDIEDKRVLWFYMSTHRPNVLVYEKKFL